MKWVHDEGGMRQRLGHAVGVSPVGVDGYGVHPVQPCFRACGQPGCDDRWVLEIGAGPGRFTLQLAQLGA